MAHLFCIEDYYLSDSKQLFYFLYYFKGHRSIDIYVLAKLVWC